MTETAAAETTTPEQKPETFLRTLMVDVPEAENDKRKDRLVAVDRKILDTEAKKATSNSGFADDIKQLKNERLKLLKAIDTGREEAEVACYLERDDRLGVMYTKRADTNEVVDDRALTVEERQTELFGQPAPEGSAPASDGATASDVAPSNEVDTDPAASTEEGSVGEAEAQQKASGGAGKVTRIRASDVKKKKAERDRKAKAAAQAGENDPA